MIFILLLVAAVLACGCSHQPPLDPDLTDFARYEAEAQALDPSGAAAAILEQAMARGASASKLLQKEDTDRARPLLAEAVADVRVAWAAALADVRSREAGRCREFLASIRGLVETSDMLLRETAKASDRPAPPSEESLPAPPADPLDALPPTLIEGADPPPLSVIELRRRVEEILSAAGDRPAPLADVRNRFEHAAAVAGDPDRNADERAHALHVARRSVQEMEARLRSHRAGEVCAGLMLPASALADANDLALRRTIQMERDARDELKDVARSREDEMYRALALLEGKYARVRREARGTIVSLPDILFDFNKAELKREVEFSLVRLATILEQFPEMSIAIEGHTDSVGTHEYNMELSERRARAVFEFLSSQGVAPERFTVEGFGMTRPVADNATAEGRARNRRVDLVIREAE